MKGIVDIVVQNERVKYEFHIRRNITVIKGDSATGKTVLVDMIREYMRQSEDSGIELFCQKNCAVIDGNDWENQLSRLHDSVVFVDEGNRFVASVDFAKYIQNTDNYYVLVTREALPSLPYSVEEIYGIRSGGKYGGLRQIYHEMYRIYSDGGIVNEVEPEIVITEDSNSGFQFFRNVCSSKNISCISATGKSNIYDELAKYKDERVIVIADGAAFGSEMDKISRMIGHRRNIVLYLPESFEWLLLISDVLDNKEIRSMIGHWENYIESAEYFSWERFFTDLLVKESQDTYLRYNKKNLNAAYLKDSVKTKILNQIKWWK